MISATDRKWFIDPIPNMAVDAKQVFVLRERYGRSNHSPGRVVDVKGKTVIDSECWWVTTTGDYVFGLPVNRVQYSGIAVGIFNDDLFVVGSSYGLGTDAAQKLRDLLPSAPLPEVLAEVSPPVTVQAAPWARDLMPLLTDSEEVKGAKIALAQKKWEMRNAQFKITVEGIEREWENYLDELRESYPAMPKPYYDSLVTGNALMLANRTANPVTVGGRNLAQFNRINGKPEDAESPTFTDVYVMTKVQASTNNVTTDIDEAQDISVGTALAALAGKFGYDLSFSGISSTPYVRSLQS